MTSRQPVDLLVTAGTVLTLDDQLTVYQPGGVAVSGATIVAVGPAAELQTAYDPRQHLTYPDDLLLPGLVNAHTHAAMTLFRGLADDLPLETWLQEHIFPAERHLSSELVYWGTRLAIAEMLLSGTTTFCDMYLFADAVAAAAADSGIRAVVGEVLYDFPSPNYGPVEAGLAFTRQLLATWRHHPLVQVAVQPHAIYTCSPALLRQCADLAAAEQARLIIHLAETRQEVAFCQERYGATPVGHLEKLGILTDFLVADHAVVLTPDDIDLLARRQVKVVHCPESNMKLASGVAPVVALLQAGVTVALGTDGCASNNNLDLLQELDTAAKLHKVHHLDPTVLPAPEVLRLATRQGAAALGLAERIGALTPGREADFIVIDGDQPHLVPLYNPYSQLVYAAGGGDVKTVVIAGRLVVQDRQLLTFDLDETLARVREYARQLGHHAKSKVARQLEQLSGHAQ